MNDRYIIEREFEHAGCKCVVTFNNMGHRCGYVGIPSTHLLYGEDYGNYLDIKKEDIGDREVSGVIPLMCDCLDNDERIKIGAYFQCHGGITYSGGGKDSEYPIASDLWWFGFDCDHYGDGKDLQYAFEKFPKYRKEISLSMECERKFPIEGEIVRSKEYVANECKRLAEQLKEFETEVH